MDHYIYPAMHNRLALLKTSARLDGDHEKVQMN